ncbi:MAG: hypothetical protein BMS9Abin10_0885 [Gammaproteobacteria bacterium]|nr:MAG: hypothetical protein BMS9Abin10_0885 [Gammaproteobacteria bacterium]
MAQTAAFAGTIILEKISVFSFRALRKPMAVIGLSSNPWVLGAWAMTIGSQVSAVYVPFLQDALYTVALGWREWLLIFAIAAPIFLIMETYKWLRWRRGASKRLLLDTAGR